eukprot:TRINITY_DN111008_c0_g1_i1.p1 TRINITY_DN111008_c0_g1~~TRINITY_DN111008_c0_g1_i1.p1  ORF type:complete len:1051 (+),score=216.22 TRINITY_DN111008_c0_g1_i1:92-3244(+)
MMSSFFGGSGGAGGGGGVGTAAPGMPGTMQAAAAGAGASMAVAQTPSGLSGIQAIARGRSFTRASPQAMASSASGSMPVTAPPLKPPGAPSTAVVLPLLRQQATRDLCAVLLRVMQRPQVAAFETIRCVGHARSCGTANGAKRSQDSSAACQEERQAVVMAAARRQKLATQELKRQVALCRDALRATSDAAEGAIFGGKSERTPAATSASASPRTVRGGPGLKAATSSSAAAQKAQEEDGLSRSCRSVRSSGAAAALEAGLEVQATEAATVWRPPTADDDMLWRELGILIASLGKENPKWAQRLENVVRRLQTNYSVCQDERDALKAKLRQPPNGMDALQKSAATNGVQASSSSTPPVPGAKASPRALATSSSPKLQGSGPAAAGDAEECFEKEVIFAGYGAASAALPHASSSASASAAAGTAVSSGSMRAHSERLLCGQQPNGVEGGGSQSSSIPGSRSQFVRAADVSPRAVTESKLSSTPQRQVTAPPLATPDRQRLEQSLQASPASHSGGRGGGSMPLLAQALRPPHRQHSVSLVSAPLTPTMSSVSVAAKAEDLAVVAPPVGSPGSLSQPLYVSTPPVPAPPQSATQSPRLPPPVPSVRISLLSGDASRGDSVASRGTAAAWTPPERANVSGHAAYLEEIEGAPQHLPPEVSLHPVGSPRTAASSGSSSPEVRAPPVPPLHFGAGLHALRGAAPVPPLKALQRPGTDAGAAAAIGALPLRSASPAQPPTLNLWSPRDAGVGLRLSGIGSISSSQLATGRPSQGSAKAAGQAPALYTPRGSAAQARGSLPSAETGEHKADGKDVGGSQTRSSSLLARATYTPRHKLNNMRYAINPGRMHSANHPGMSRADSRGPLPGQAPAPSEARQVVTRMASGTLIPPPLQQQLVSASQNTYPPAGSPSGASGSSSSVGVAVVGRQGGPSQFASPARESMPVVAGYGNSALPPSYTGGSAALRPSGGALSGNRPAVTRQVSMDRGVGIAAVLEPYSPRGASVSLSGMGIFGGPQQEGVPRRSQGGHPAKAAVPSSEDALRQFRGSRQRQLSPRAP